MKPIFNEEKLFLEENLGIKLPNSCWRDGSKIYLNIDTRPAIIEFKVENGKIYIKKNNIKEIHSNNDVTISYKKGKKIITEKFKNLTWQEEFDLRKDYLMNLEQEGIDKTIEYISKYPNHEQRISISGGKDSDLLYFIMQKVYKQLGVIRENYEIDIFNTTNDTAQTYLHIKNDFPIIINDIHTPEKGWYRWLAEDKNWFLPSAMVRNCCSHFKEGNLNKLLDKKKEYILFVGMRKYESAKRSKYDWDLNEAIKKQGEKKLNVPENWRRFLPIVNFKDEDVWLMLLHYKIKFNDMYRYGYNRCGCLLCPYASDYTDMITKKYYPLLMNRWEDALDKNYELYNIERLKWTREEWKLGKWKQGTSKEYELINLKPTKERIKQLAEIKGISEEMAEKYFQKKCSCDKKLNPDEIAMFLKRNGRFEGIEDNRQYLCKECLCKELGMDKKEYSRQVREFREQGCKLF